MAVKKQSFETSGPASGSPDELDAGWDLESGWDDEPAQPKGARFEPVPAVISYVSESSIPVEVAPVAATPSVAPPSSVPPLSTRPTSRNDGGTLRPAELEVTAAPKVANSPVWPKFAAAAAVLVVMGGAFAKFNSDQHGASAAAERAAAQSAPPQAQEALPLPSSVSTPIDIAAAAAVPSPAPETPPSPALEAAPPEAAPTQPPEATPSARDVTVSVSPKGSIIFDHGKRIGTDVVHVTVEAGQPKRLVALRDGYLPKKFSVESGTSDVHISLKPATDPSSVPMAPSAPIASAR